VNAFQAARANAISERWMKSMRAEYLDYLFAFNETGNLTASLSVH
jgi:hypothetical protein